jgi:peptide subunit release factor 1 (eRF1)
MTTLRIPKNYDLEPFFQTEKEIAKTIKNANLRNRVLTNLEAMERYLDEIDIPENGLILSVDEKGNKDPPCGNITCKVPNEPVTHFLYESN